MFFARKRLYATMFAVLVIAAFIIIVPQNLYNTISSKSFITYMGIGNCDLRLDIQQTDNISQKAAEIAKTMESDKSVSKYVVLTTKTFNVKTEGGLEERIKIELGDHSVFPVKYYQGRAPAAKDDIALSAINADELGKNVGDDLTVVIDGKQKDLTVCGIYSDITNGGKTAKAVFNDNSADIMWCNICAELLDKSLVDSKVSQYADRFNFAKVSGIDEYISQTFGTTKDSVKKAADAAVAVALLITVLVTLLFMKMLVVKDRYSIAVIKAFGFTNQDIKAQYLARAVFILIVGIILGTLLANTLGETLAGIVISQLGVSSFNFAINPLATYLLCPLMMVFAVLIATIIGVSAVGQIKISQNIKE